MKHPKLLLTILIIVGWIFGLIFAYAFWSTIVKVDKPVETGDSSPEISITPTDEGWDRTRSCELTLEGCVDVKG